MTDSSPVRLDYVAAGCNRVVGALDWAEAGLIAYCAHHAIAIYNPATSSIISTLLGHTDKVTCLRWFKASDFGLESSTSSLLADQPQTLALASGGGDGSICLWLLTLDNPSQPWSLAATLPAHKGAVTSISIHNAGSPGSMVLVATAGDGDVTIWAPPRNINHPASLLSSSSSSSSEEKENSVWNLTQRISYGTKLQHCSTLTALPAEPQSLLLALGGVDGKVRLLLSSSSQDTTSTDSSSNEFKLVCELSGHQNWVRGLAFTYLAKDSKILLASASQDRYIRLWAITPDTLSNTATGAATSSVSTSKESVAASLMKFAPRPRFSSPMSGVTYQATLEALLIGHEDWVHSVAWKPRRVEGEEEVPYLLSASMDRTMALWVPDKATGEFLSFSPRNPLLRCFGVFF
jgi:elongator complex protein 2